MHTDVYLMSKSHTVADNKKGPSLLSEIAILICPMKVRLHLTGFTEVLGAALH
jgi:hypothetical protein